MAHVTLPPSPSKLRSDGTLPGGWWHDVSDGRMVCDLCPRECKLKPGDRGFCFVRQNRDGEMVLTTYGKSTGFCIDPIEKKPLNHFYPGTSVLSFGTAGCNLGCKFCQNHEISKARETELLSEFAMPETIANAAAKLGCKSVAYTYNDPIIWAEYAIDTAKACRQQGIQSVAVTAGYIKPEAREPFFEFFDAANVDLKAFTEEFYEKVTLSQLQPILDTLQWLQKETDVWFEITNLLIPDANDSPDEIRRMCEWILNHVGDQVPVHFSAFHPDFRMQDRSQTPHETLLAAYEIARSTGLRYVYLGNIHDEIHQSTYCDACGELVIQRDWYQLGAYHLKHNRCNHCGHELPGHFAEQPGDWGRQRQPIKISDFALVTDDTLTSSQNSAKGNVMNLEVAPEANPQPTLKSLSVEQQQSVIRVAADLVTSAVTGHNVELNDDFEAIGMSSVFGVYVSLKRNGHLRGCCGFTNRETPLVDGLKYSATRTALDDPRFPPVSPSELPYLDLEVWLLGEMLRVTAEGEARVKAIQVGRDGLFIERADQRGLLLPGVATDRDWDEETFLRQVCIKAQLPPSAWREPDTILHRFEGLVAKGHFSECITSEHAFSPVVDEAAIHSLAQFCRDNIHLLSKGALPSYYLQSVNDGMVHGVVLAAKWGNGRQTWLAKKSLRSPMPLQATLFSLCQDFVRQVGPSGLDVDAAQVDLAVLEDPAMHGSSSQPDLRGADDNRAMQLIGPGRSDTLVIDPQLPANGKLASLRKLANLRDDQAGTLLSFHVRTTAPLQVSNSARPVAGPEVRLPGVAGRFYPATPKALASMVRKLVPKELPSTAKWRAAMIPHAGLQYSGAIAAEVLSHIQIPQQVIVIGPKHTPHGVDWAVAPHKTWTVPGLEIANNQQLAQTLAENIAHLELDAEAHRDEHCIEVELPLLHYFAPQAAVVGIAIGSGDLRACHEFATSLAATLRTSQEDLLLLISSDMNHFASDAETRRLDEMAMQAIETLNVEQIFRTVRDNEISMCGLLPAIIALDALHQLKPLTVAERVRYGTSADINHDKSRVVGYAGMLFR